jgi:hypothetical protein
VTEDSRNHMRGYGSFPEGAEPTEEIAAFGDPTAELPTSRSSARPSIPSQPPTPAAARPSRPWSAPPPAFAPSGVTHAEPRTATAEPFRTAEPPPRTAEPPSTAEPPRTAEPPPRTAEPPRAAEPPRTAEPLPAAESLPGVSSPVRRPLYGGVRRATVEPPGDVQPMIINPPGEVQSVIIEPHAHGEPDPWRDDPAGPPSETDPDFDAPSGDLGAPHAAVEPPGVYPVWPASLEQPEGHRPPPPARPAASPWDPAASGWPEEPPASAGSRPEAVAEEYAYPTSAPPGPFFAPARSDQEPTGSDSSLTSFAATPAIPDENPPSPIADWSPGPTPRPRHDQRHTEDRHGLPATPSRRIAPTPSDPHPTRLFAGLVIGLIAGLLLFGTAGWFTGRATAPKSASPKPAPQAVPTPTPTPTLGLFEQTQATLNAAHFKGPNLAQPWLPYLANCATTTPAQADGEKNRVRCTIDGMSAFFVEYKSTAERDKARGKLQPQVREASTLTPGAKPPGKTAEGNYVEYAYRLTEGGVTRTVAGIWWDDAQRPTAAYLLAYWKDGLGERWDPMRDLWSRYA